MPAPPMRPADTIGNLGSTLGNMLKTISSKGPQGRGIADGPKILPFPFPRQTGGGGGLPNIPGQGQRFRLPPRQVSSIPAPGAGGVGSLLRPYNPMDTYSGLVQRGMAAQPPMPQSPYGGIMDYLMNRPVFSRGERPEGSILPPAGPQQMPQQPAFDQEAFRTQLFDEFKAQQQPAFDQEAFRTQLLDEFKAQQQPAFDQEAFRAQIMEEMQAGQPNEQISALEQQIADLRAQLAQAQEGRVDQDALRQQIMSELNPQQQMDEVNRRIADLQSQVVQGSKPVDVDEIRRQIMRELQSNEGRAMLEREQMTAYQAPGGMTDASREEARLAAIEEAIRPTQAAASQRRAPTPAARTTIPAVAQNFQLPAGFRMPTNLFSGIR